jgi:hypothetical protein
MLNKYTQPPREKKNVGAASNLPVKTFRLGRIKAAVWENEGEQKFYSVTFTRTYVTKDIAKSRRVAHHALPPKLT